jgi:subtilisin family serine protease
MQLSSRAQRLVIFAVLAALALLAGGASPRERAHPPAGAAGDGVLVRVSLYAPGHAADVAADVAAAGGDAVRHSRDFVAARVPTDALPALTRHPLVRQVGRVADPAPRPAASAGGPRADRVDALELVNARAWHAAGLTGSGVKVGIIDAGFEGYATVARADPPALVEEGCNLALYTPDDPYYRPLETGGGHGTEVAAIVNAVAPDAELYLVNAYLPHMVQRGLDCLAAAGVRVINFSSVLGGEYEGPGNGTGPFNEGVVDYALSIPVAGAPSAGMFWVNAAGNSGREHWGGHWRAADPDGNAFAGFLADVPGEGEFIPFTLDPGQELNVDLRWTDDVNSDAPWGSECNDFNLALRAEPRHDAAALVAGADPQAGLPGDVPHEHVTFVAPFGGTFYADIHHAGIAGTCPYPDPYLDLMAFPSPPPEYVVSDKSLLPPADHPSPALVSVGALAPDVPQAVLPFSARGPAHGSDARHREKPDLAAPGGTLDGEQKGTSFAAPHVSGAAALVLQARPGLSPAELGDFLRHGATADIGPEGWDGASGWGRLRLPAPQPPEPTPQVPVPQLQVPP